MSRDATLQLVRSALPSELRRRIRSAWELGRNRRDEASVERFSTPLAPLNHLLGGGLPRGKLVEIVAHRSCGSFSMLLGTLGIITRGGHVAGLVDLGNGLSPRTAAESFGIDLERLLWVRPPALGEALAAAEILVSGDFPFVALDLGSSPVAGRRGTGGAWLRLARTARKRRTALLVITPRRISGAAADTVIETRSGDVVWDRSRRGIPLLQGLRSELTLAKRSGTAPGERGDLAFHLGSSRAAIQVVEASAETSAREPSGRAWTLRVAG